MSVIVDIIVWVGGGSAILAGVTWLLREALRHSANRDLVQFKSRLETTATTEIERVRSELRIVEAERGKQTALLQEKRADLIDQLYKRLIDFLAAAETFTAVIEWSGEPTKDEKAKVLSERTDEFFHFFVRHRIYFSAALCEKIQHLYDTVRMSTTSYNVWRRAVKDHDSSDGKFLEAWDKAAQTIQKDVPPLMSAIEEEFRSLLGVTSDLTTCL